MQARRGAIRGPCTADARGCLLAIVLTGGEAHDCPLAARLIRRLKTSKHRELREELREHGARPVTPNRSNRKQPFGFNKRLYKPRWLIEKAFDRLKDFTRIATRYDPDPQPLRLRPPRYSARTADLKSPYPNSPQNAPDFGRPRHTSSSNRSGLGRMAPSPSSAEASHAATIYRPRGFR